VPLAVDEGLAGFTLRLQRIELLLEPLLGRFAGVNCTTDGFGSAALWFLVFSLAGLGD
jgi:hypothetical protein